MTDNSFQRFFEHMSLMKKNKDIVDRYRLDGCLSSATIDEYFQNIKTMRAIEDL